MGIKQHNAGLLDHLEEGYAQPGPKYDTELWGALGKNDVEYVISKNINILQNARAELMQRDSEGALSVLIIDGQLDLLWTLRKEMNAEIRRKQDDELFGQF